ncbi:MAG: cytidine deaminase [Acholeplasmatales bacterium]|nr:cytidine deaminase [Acholeplasmatales bacterium]
MTFDIEKLIDNALAAKANAYAPYSKFKVGAAILLKNGKYILGCNIENKSYSMTMCAERCALFKLISECYTRDDVVAICVVANSDNPVTPCGACREVMDELLYPDTPVILSNNNRDRIVTTVKELLPLSFKLER